MGSDLHLFALQIRRLQRLMADAQEPDGDLSEPVRSGNLTLGEPAAFPGPQQVDDQRGARYATKEHLPPNQRRNLNAQPRRHLLLQQLRPARLACSQVAHSSPMHAKHRASTDTGQPASGSAHAVHDDAQLASGAEGARNEHNSAPAAAGTSGWRWPRQTLPWEQLALEARRAAAARSSRTQRKEDGGDRTKQQAFSMLSDTGDDTDGFSSSGESEVSGGDGDGDGGRMWRPSRVADELLDGSLEQRLVVHRMLWGAKVRMGGTHRPVGRW